MEFKKNGTSFSTTQKFGDDMKRFAADEVARFQSDSNEAASASVDEAFEHAFRFSKEKSKGRIKEQKDILEGIQKEKEEESEKINEAKVAAQGTKDKFSEKSQTEESCDKPLSQREKEAKKTKSKETKKAASKTAIANVFKAKKELSNDLVRDESSGDALKDGSGGLLKVFLDAVNPMRYLKKFFAKIAAVIGPYILIFMAVFSIFLIIISFLFSVLQPIAEVGEALETFVSFFTGDSGIVNSTFTQAEIDEIVAASGATESEAKVIRFALSKVGYPYSQDLRTSGSAYDCSSLAYYSWKDAAVDFSGGSGYPPTAAEGARALEASGKSLATMDLRPGDLVYYGGESNGRYLGIYHVAIYVGNGYCVEAYNEKYGVIYQKLRTKNAIMVCRPS